MALSWSRGIARSAASSCSAGGALRRVIFVGDAVAEPVGVAQVAAEDGVERVALEAGFVAGLEQLEQPVVRALFGSPGPAAGFGAAGATGAGAGAGVVAQAASAAMDAPRKQIAEAVLHRSDLRIRVYVLMRKGRRGKPQRPFDQRLAAVYQKKL